VGLRSYLSPDEPIAGVGALTIDSRREPIIW